MKMAIDKLVVYSIVLALLQTMVSFGGETYTWIRTSRGNWSDSANWTPGGGPPAAGDTALFLDATGRTIELGTASVDTLRVDNGNWTWTGGSLELSTLLHYNSANSSASLVSGVINGAGKVKVSGGILTLSGANSYSGGTLLEGGILEISNASALGSGLLTLASGIIRNSSTTTSYTIANPFMIGGDFSIGSGKLGPLIFSGDGYIADGVHTIIRGGGNDSTGFTGSLSGAGGLILCNEQANSFQLLGANTFEGGFTLLPGVGYLLLGNDTALGSGLFTAGDMEIRSNEARSIAYQPVRC